jgi:putative flippase GtrA
MILTNSRERKRFMRFAVVGIIGAIIDFSLFNLQTLLFGVQPVLAQAFSFTAAVISNFIWNRYWTYPDSRSKSIPRQIIQFFVVNIIGLLIRTPLISYLGPILVSVFDNVTIPFGLTSSFLGHNISLAFAVGVVMLWNFFINRFWTYSDVQNS